MQSSDSLLAAEIGRLLSGPRLTISVAESCTGGMLSMMLTSVPGASEWFNGGVTAYSRLIKEAVLGVPEDVLSVHGEVSGETAAAMAAGVMKLTGSDLSLAVTGIAGPGGGSREKPVGTVWMALCRGSRILTWKEHFDGERDEVRRGASRCLLEKLRRHLQEVYG